MVLEKSEKKLKIFPPFVFVQNNFFFFKLKTEFLNPLSSDMTLISDHMGMCFSSPKIDIYSSYQGRQNLINTSSFLLIKLID